MKFWRNQPHVCSECRAYFQPWPAGANEPTDLCGTCRAPVIARAQRILVVLEWARQNWESLEPQAIQFTKERTETYQHYAGSFAAQQQAAKQTAGYPGASDGLGGLFR